MAGMLETVHQSPAARLVVLFVAWKTLLTVLAAFCPGPGYDTSALILSHPGPHRHVEFQSWLRIDRLTISLFRWDSLYFVKAAQRSYVHEQEWAFSWVYSGMVRTLVKYVCGNDYVSLKQCIWAGIAISYTCHLISVLVLFRFFTILLGREQNGRVPFIASVLHIMSPASLFLCSPCAEAVFSAANFTGMLHYALARTSGKGGIRTVRQDAYMVSSGVLFASATLVRSNGLLSGLIYLYDVVASLPCIFTLQLDRQELRRIFFTCVAGCLVAIGFVGPQYLAYEEYCATTSSESKSRPWCEKTIPSIYTWVQNHYWNVGFLRYWTLSNLPLFLIAAPMLWLLLQSGVTFLRNPPERQSAKPNVPQKTVGADSEDNDRSSCNLPQLALPQIVLALAAMTSFHVQVINRLSSGYPIWYIALANWVVSRRDGTGKVESQWAIRGIVMYALVQGMLFANFLPPA
ncbi:glycosyltransferase family 76 protein [Zopfia rhizophila CBS 207.26]|uniref:GPI mannosyltransferase 2 n=1 Tax=Zopfia rhizophila CBS 207.26 TaxID=1314779 RepID=A0A6A6EBB3_9PEZI|nr:glycosyltransferase family 76 protein [Zopfia rhizophila CBS 207.26]